jgi:hypothetical protein
VVQEVLAVRVHWRLAFALGGFWPAKGVPTFGAHTLVTEPPDNIIGLSAENPWGLVHEAEKFLGGGSQQGPRKSFRAMQHYKRG